MPAMSSPSTPCWEECAQILSFNFIHFLQITGVEVKTHMSLGYAVLLWNCTPRPSPTTVSSTLIIMMAVGSAFLQNMEVSSLLFPSLWHAHDLLSLSSIPRLIFSISLRGHISSPYLLQPPTVILTTPSLTSIRTPFCKDPALKFIWTLSETFPPFFTFLCSILPTFYFSASKMSSNPISKMSTIPLMVCPPLYFTGQLSITCFSCTSPHNTDRVPLIFILYLTSLQFRLHSGSGWSCQLKGTVDGWWECINQCLRDMVHLHGCGIRTFTQWPWSQLR